MSKYKDLSKFIHIPYDPYNGDGNISSERLITVAKQPCLCTRLLYQGHTHIATKCSYKSSEASRGSVVSWTILCPSCGCRSRTCFYGIVIHAGCGPLTAE